MYKILKISLLAMFVVSFAVAFAQDDQGMPPMEKPSVTVASDHQPFWLFIDDVRQNQESVKSIKVEGVPDGQHKLYVEIHNESHNIVGRIVVIQQENNNYWVNEQRNMYGISLGKKVQNPEAVVPFAMPVPKSDPRSYKHHDGSDRPHARPDNHIHGKPQRPPRQKRIKAMDDEDFVVALENISSRKFEADKLETAKQIAANNMLRVGQIKHICQLFEYESSKLDFAKSAYNRCTEQDKYYQINDVFQFENSKTELEQYVQQQIQQQEREKEKEMDHNVPIDK